MKIDFTNINDLTTCFARELRLLKLAILESNDKDELQLKQTKIELASLECQNAILSKMLEEAYCCNDTQALFELQEDFNVNGKSEETD